MDEEVTTDTTELNPTPPPPVPPGEQPKPPETETVEIEPMEDPADPRQEPTDPDNKVTGFERRVQRLSAQKEAAEREAEYWRRHATQPPAAPPPPADKKPVFTDYNDLELYAEAVSNWTAAKAVRDALSERDREQGNRTVLERYQQKVDSFKAITPDFDAVFADLDDVQLEPDLLQAVLEADEGPALAYHLAKNLSEVRRLNSMTPAQRLMALGKLEATLPKKGTPAPAPKNKVSAAPAALKTPNSTTASTKLLEEMSPEEFIAYRNKTVGRR